MSKTATPAPTIKAVIQYAEKLKLQAERQTAGDVYAKPYWPPMCKTDTGSYVISEQAIRKLIQRCGSPAHALEALRLKVISADNQAREEAQASQRALERHARRQKASKRVLLERRSELSPGQRIDKALAELSTISTVSASVLDSDRVHGGERNQAPQWGDDPCGSARGKAVRLAVELEAVLDSARARDLAAA